MTSTLPHTRQELPESGGAMACSYAGVIGQALRAPFPQPNIGMHPNLGSVREVSH